MTDSFADHSPNHWRLIDEQEFGFRLEPRRNHYYRRAVIAIICMAPVIVINWLVDGAVDFKQLFTVMGVIAMAAIAGVYIHFEHLSRRLGPYIAVSDGEVRLRGGHRILVEELDGFEIKKERRNQETVYELSIRLTLGDSIGILTCNDQCSVEGLKHELKSRMKAIAGP